MTNEEFKELLLEEQIFNKEKDCSVVASDKFRKKYKDWRINHSRLYRRIVNYQVKKYGASLDNDAVIPYISEVQKIRNKQRRYDTKRRLHEKV